MFNELRGLQYDSSGYTDENSLARMMLTKPGKINKGLTYLWGKDTDKFPLSFLTEGQGQITEVDEIEYYWDIMGRAKITEEVISSAYAGNDRPGVNFTLFYAVFKTNWFPRDWNLIAPDRSSYRVMEDPIAVTNGYRYTLKMNTTTPGAFCALSNFTQGAFWVLSTPTVAESKSRGNKSNAQAPGKLKNQISFQRYTKKIAGNAANKVSEIEFPTKQGGTTTRWINEEMRQFEVLMRQMNEEHLWTSQYNRLPDGSITMLDLETGEPIPHSAGILEVIYNSNYDTYGFDLTVNKIKTTINDVFYNDTDSGAMEVVLYCGKGFAEDFDNAIKQEGQSNSYWFKLGDAEITSGKDGYLEYGKYFTQYRHITGHVVTVKTANFFDFGSISEMERKNGIVHPRSGYPLFSHTGIFLDQSVYDGERNIKMATMKGQADLMGIVKGITPIPESWMAAGMPLREGSLMSHDRDEASYERKFSKGVNISNTTRCFALQCTI